MITKIKVTKKRKTRSKTQNNRQLELKFIENPKKKIKDNSQTQTINSISRIFLSSFVLVSFFYIAPILINFTDKNFNTKEYTNNSKKIFIYMNFAFKNHFNNALLIIIFLTLFCERHITKIEKSHISDFFTSFVP